MNHSFNVEVAKNYGIEKAVILENFYYWCKKNQANRVNIHNGRAYTYNTSEALAEIFVYIKPRQIARLLREMESEGLLISGQFLQHDRTKSYTLSDLAVSFYEPTTSFRQNENTENNTEINSEDMNSEIENKSEHHKKCQCIITKSDDGTSQKVMMEHHKKCGCLNTNINTDIKPDINTDIADTQKKQKNENDTQTKKFVKPSLLEIKNYCLERNNSVDFNKFYDYYESNGWKVGRNAMKDWRACVRTWEKNNFNSGYSKSSGAAMSHSESAKKPIVLF